MSEEAAEERHVSTMSAGPTIPPNLPVDSDLLSSQLDQLQVGLPSDLSQELDSNLTTSL